MSASTASGRGARTGAVLATLADALRARVESTGRDVLDIVDLGGGSGTFAVPLAAAGHRVTVVDPSPDALATLGRRTAENRLSVQVTGVQGDAAGLVSLIGAAGADVVLCHGVLEIVDDPVAAAQAVATCLRPAGVCSVVAAHRYGALVAKAVAGQLGDARRLLDDPNGRWGDADPLPRRFDESGLTALLVDVGLSVESVRGVGMLTELVNHGGAEEPAEAAQLADLERAAAAHPTLRALAGALHVLAVKR